jgi:hypothetical protein
METPELEITSLAAMDHAALKDEWERLVRQPLPRLSAQLLRLEIAYRLQEERFGGLSPVTKATLRQAAPSNTPMARKPRTGAHIVREWNGVTHLVEVIEGGFRYKDRTFASLTAIAFEITGARWSGPRFFGLKSRARA